MLEMIRFQDREIKKFKSILCSIMHEDQIEAIESKAEWNEDRRDWKIPLFTLKDKMVVLPKLHH